MKLTNLLKVRQFGLSENIYIKDKTIFLNDIETKIELRDWQILEQSKFTRFLKDYSFPKNEEFSKRDRDTIRENIPKPQILLEKIGFYQDHNPIIAMYLYNKKQLTGESVLHLRSINKFEQMQIRFFINTLTSPMNNPRVFSKNNYEYCQSSDICFEYKFANDENKNLARLRILTLGFGEFVLLIYVFNKNEFELTQEEIDGFLDSIKSST